MLSLVLLAGKIAFLVLLYVFVYLVIRSATRDLRAASRATVVPVMPAGPVPVSGAAAGTGGAPAGTPARSSQTAPSWNLVVAESRHLPRGGVFVVPLGDHMVIGRAAENEISLSDTFVSAHHARVDARQEGLYVQDLASTNGTYVNGVPIEGGAWLHPGDRLGVGDTEFEAVVG